jgi:hypothetical protein
MLEDNIWTEDLWIDGEGIRKMRRFFKNFCKEFAEYSLQYHRILGEFPFIYNEKSVNSVVLPALMNTGKKTFVFMEHPFKKEDGTQRFLDFYVHNEDNLYLIELKHGWNSERTNGITQSVLSKWEKVHEQINDLTNKSITQLCIEGSYKNVFKIALLIMPVYSQRTADFNLAQEYCTELRKNMEENKANWFGVWKINEHNKYEHEFKNGEKQFYPYVSFIVYQEKIEF